MKNEDEIRSIIQTKIENKHINTMDDLLFKFIFGKEERKHFTIDFLNSVLSESLGHRINDIEFRPTEQIPYNKADVAASFQKAVVDVLVEHSMLALEKGGEKRFAIAGGVAANRHLRAAFENACRERAVEFYCPPPVLCTDNAAMIGSAAYFEYIKGVRHGLDLNAMPALRLGERI